MSWIVTYLIVCPLVGLAGFVDAIAGGGGLISLPAYLIAGLPAHAAIATNKFSAFWGTLIATIKFWRKGMVHLKYSVPAIAAALAGSALGAELALRIPDGVFRIVLMIVIPITAFVVISKKELKSRKSPFSNVKTMLIAAAIALIIGVYDGFYGPGTGTFLLLLLVYGARMSLNNSAGMTKVINLATNASALVVFLANGVVMFPLAIVAALFGIAGNYIGANVFIGKGQKIVRPIILLVMLLLLVKLIFLS